MEHKNNLKGGRSDKLTLNDISKKFNVTIEFLKKQLESGIKVEREHTTDKNIAREIATDHLAECPKYYIKLAKMEKTFPKETKEQTMSDASGSVVGAMNAPIVKRKIHQSEFKEATDSSSSGAFSDVPFGGKNIRGGRKDPLKIDGPESIKHCRAVTDPNFPRFGGKKGQYVEGYKSNKYQFVSVKEKCKKFPYCNQGDINALDFLNEAIIYVAKKRGMPVEVVNKIVAKEINRIFI